MAITAAAAAIALGAFGLAHQRASDRPVGEGALFASEGMAAREELADLLDETDPAAAVRHLRNDLMIEAVSLVTPDGRITHSTSQDLVGSTITNPHLSAGIGSGRLTAMAGPISHPITIDGVTEWEAGDVLYEVAQPVDGGALVLSYDMGELLERRAAVGGVQPLTVQLIGGAAVLVLIAFVFVIGRARVVRRNEAVFLEAQLLREHSRELEETNQRLRAAREAAVDALALAEEKNRIRAEFVLMINHEIRTPLTAIVTGAELLGSGTPMDPADRQTVIDDMVADGRRLEGLIARMLEAARLENRGLSLTMSDHDSADVCAGVCEMIPRATCTVGDSGLRIHTHLPTLLQLIGSLADNAVTHGAHTVTVSASDSLALEPSIETGTRPADAVYFSVSDDGPGIDPDFLPRIFEKFEKRGFASGTGLGLYLASTMVRALGGSLAVATSPDGTTFTVAVPRAMAAELGDAA